LTGNGCGRTIAGRQPLLRWLQVCSLSVLQFVASVFAFVCPLVSFLSASFLCASFFEVKRHSNSLAYQVSFLRGLSSLCASSKTKAFRLVVFERLVLRQPAPVPKEYLGTQRVSRYRKRLRIGMDWVLDTAV